MLLTINNLILITSILTCFYWSFFNLSRKNFFYRKISLTFTSCFILFLYNPLIIVILIIFTIYSYFCFLLAKKLKLFNIIWLIFIPLIISNFIDFNTIRLSSNYFGNPLSIFATNTFFLGFSYYSIKTFGSLKIFLKNNKFNLLDLTLSNIFYPTFACGPINYSDNFSNVLFKSSFDKNLFISGLIRLGHGILKIILINTILISKLSIFLFGKKYTDIDINWQDTNLYFAIIFSVFSFVKLYVNFSAFTDIAVGIGQIFHIKIPENFNYPLLSHSIQNFWQRWHLSLSHFINVNIFIPLYRRTGNLYFSIYITFIFAGLWHRVNLGYFLWGLFHGTALIFYYKFFKDESCLSKFPKISKIVGTFLTILFVSIVSTLANLNSNADISHYILSFFRI